VLGVSGGGEGKSGEEDGGEREGEMAKAHDEFPSAKWLRGHDIAVAVDILNA